MLNIAYRKVGRLTVSWSVASEFKPFKNAAPKKPARIPASARPSHLWLHHAY